MDSAQSVSSRESLYSVESTASEEEEEERSTDFEVFLLDSGSDTEKGPGLLRRLRDASPEGRGFLFPPESGRTHQGLRCWDRRRRVRKPTRTPSRLPHCLSPVGLEETYCARLVEPDGTRPRKATSQKWAESRGRKRLSASMGGGQTPTYTTTPPLRGMKRQRNKEMEAGGGLAAPWTEKDQLFAQKVGSPGVPELSSPKRPPPQKKTQAASPYGCLWKVCKPDLQPLSVLGCKPH